MSKKFKYVGPHDAVEIAGVGVVERNHQVEIDDPDVSKGLVGQADWEHIPDKKRSAVAKKAAATRSDEPATAEPSDNTPAED